MKCDFLNLKPLEFALGIVLAIASLQPAHAQVELTDWSPYQQNFDLLSGTTWANNSTLPGWYAGYGTTTSITNASSITELSSNGAANTLCSYGQSGNADRALGGKGGTGSNYFIGVRIKNTTDRAIKSFTISYKAESYTQVPSYSFSYTTSNTTSLGYGTGTAVSVLGASSVATIYKNINGLNIPVGGEIMFRWENTADRNIAIDDIIITPSDVDMCFNVSGTTLTTTSSFFAHPDGTSTVAPAANMGIAAIGARTASLGETIASGILPTGSKIILGDGLNALTFTIPANYSLASIIDIRSNATLNLNNTTLPTLGLLASNSNVVYNNATVIPAATYGNLTISGARTLSAGTITVNGALSVNAGSSFTQTGGQLNLNGSLNTATGTYAFNGGEVVFSATTGEQNVPGLTYSNLTLGGSGIKRLQANATVNGVLNCSGSHLVAASPITLTLGSAGTITNETTAHYYKGKLVKTATISGAGNHTFGGMGLEFNNTGLGNWGLVTVTRTTDLAIANPNDASKEGIKRSWNIAPAAQAGTNVNMTYKWFTTEDSHLNLSGGQAQAWKSTDNGLTWKPAGDLITISTNGDVRTATFITNSFSIWTFSDPVTPLPVSWLFFKGKAAENGNNLTWATASEKNSESFVVERSANGKTFETIGTVKAAGNSNQILNYQFSDKQPLTNAVSYYRLKQTDTDGAFEYSSMIVVAKNEHVGKIASVYPNPFGKALTLQLAAGQHIKEVIMITADGKEVYRKNMVSASETELTGLPALQPGLYLLKLVSETGTSTLKVMRQ